jgi:hypothetical protein
LSKLKNERNFTGRRTPKVFRSAIVKSPRSLAGFSVSSLSTVGFVTFAEHGRVLERWTPSC